MAKSSNVSYDFYVMANGKWTHRGRYPGHMRDYVLREAKEGEARFDTAVKVIRDFYNEETEAWEEATVYVSSGAYASAVAKVAANNNNAARPAPLPSAVLGTNAAMVIPNELTYKASTIFNQLIRLVVIMFVSFAIAIAVTLFVMQFLQTSNYISMTTLMLYSTYFAVGVFTLAFVLSSAPMLFWFIDGQVFKIHFPFLDFFVLPASQPKHAPTEADTLISELAIAKKKTSPKKRWEEPIVTESKEKEVLSASLESVGLEEENLPPPPEPDAVIEDPAALEMDQDKTLNPVESGKQKMLRFLKVIISAFRAERRQLDLDGYNKLGMQCVFAGALEILAQTRKLQPDQVLEISLEIQKLIEIPPLIATMFVDRYQQYKGDSNTGQMIETGLLEMRKFMEDQTYIPDSIVSAFDSWEIARRTFVTEIAADRTILPSGTQEQCPAVILGEIAPVPAPEGSPAPSAEDVNLLVEERDVYITQILEQYCGQQIRDGGHSVTATFPDCESALKASMDLLTIISVHSRQTPSRALYGRIGIFSAGEEMPHEAAEKEAWAICGAADYGQILCNDNTARLLPVEKTTREATSGHYLVSWH